MSGERKLFYCEIIYCTTKYSDSKSTLVSNRRAVYLLLRRLFRGGGHIS